MRTSEGPLKTMKNLKELGYKNIVNFVVVHKDISLEACKLRADIMNDGNHIIRRVPNSFHELCVNTLPDSCNEIFKCGYLDEHIIDNFVITTRDSNIVWNSNNYKKLPGEVLNEYLNNYLLSINFTNDVELAKKAFSNESVGLKKNDDIERLKLLKEKIAELINDNPAPIMKK